MNKIYQSFEEWWENEYNGNMYIIDSKELANYVWDARQIEIEAKDKQIDYYKMATDAFNKSVKEMEDEIDSWKKALIESIEDEHGKQEEGFECNLFKQYENKWVKMKL